MLCLFIVSIIACAWCLLTMFSFHRYRTTSLFVTLVDVAFLGALIASVVLLRAIAHSNCISWNIPIYVSVGSNNVGSANGYFHASKDCTLMKAAWALAIADCVFFAVTALMALSLYRDHSRNVTVVHTKESRRSGSSDHSHRHHPNEHHHHHQHHSHSRTTRTYDV